MKKCRYIMLIFLWSVIQETTAFAGWHSGGGELFTDADNPWFLQNTSYIHYCIQIDEVNFGQDRRIVNDKIHASFAYWKNEFSSERLPPTIGFPRVPVLLATQTLVEVSCQDEHDLTFQFGVLSDEQARFLVYPEKVVAKSVRTTYDPKSLKGKGFVYVSPEKGQYALKGPGPHGALMPHRWRHAMGRNLEMVLVHEWGHIFGIRHIESMELDMNMMAESFPAEIISWPIGYMIAPDSEIPWFFAREKDLFISTFRDEFSGHSKTAEFLGLPDGMTGLLELRASDDHSRLDLVIIPQQGGSSRLIGSFFGRKEGDPRLFPFASIYVTPVQNLFQGIPPEGRREGLYYPQSMERSMRYVPAHGGPPKVFGIEVVGHVATFKTVDDSWFYFDLFGMSNANILKVKPPQSDPGM